MKLRNRLVETVLLFGTAFLVSGGPAAAQCGCGCPSYQIVNKVVYDQVPVTAYRLEYETLMEEQHVTTLRPEWTEEIRERRYTVAKPVMETATREERYVVRRPVYETSFREEAYDRVSYVTETEMRQQKYLVQRPVVETQMREQQYTVQRAVQETVMQQQAYTAYQPVTSYQTQLVDQGQYVTAYQPVVGRSHCCLRCIPGQCAVNPATGQSAYYRGGLRWVQQPAPTYMQPTSVYMPNVVQQQIATTSYQPVQMTQQVPVTVNRLVDEVVTQQVPVTVQRTEVSEEVRDYQVAVPTSDGANREQGSRANSALGRARAGSTGAVHRQRIEYEERVEQIPVKTCRYVNETKAVQVPRTVGKWVAYQSTRLQPRVVTMRVPLGPVIEAPIYSAPVVRTAPAVSPAPAISPAPPRVTAPQPAQKPATSGSGAQVQPQNGSKAKSPSGSGSSTSGSSTSEKPEESQPTPADRPPSLEAPGNARHTSFDRSA